MKKPKFKITYKGPVGGDCTQHVIYELEEPMTVRELCEYILSTNEWGHIGIQDKDSFSYGTPSIEYWKHKYIDENCNPIQIDWPEKILNAYVRKIDWYGGWSLGNWKLTI